MRSISKLLLAIALDVILFMLALKHGLMPTLLFAFTAWCVCELARNIYFIFYRPGE